MSSARPPAPPPQLPGFRYISVLGSGGYADVYLYEQERPRRPVAVKVLLAAGLTDSRIRQFAAEADLMARLSAHPYIVTIYGADVADDGRPYLVMEYYPGAHLGVRARRGSMPVADILRVGIQVGGAVESAHRLGIVHRDIKPANILTSEYGRPGLTDFGISVQTSAAPVGADDDPGGMSIPWAAPEVFRPEVEPDERSDVYSLGATVWHLLAGRSPFEVARGDNRPLVMMRRVENDSVRPTGRADVPASLERILEQSMSKKPEARHDSVFEFARALQAVQQDMHTTVTPIELPEADGSDEAWRDDPAYGRADVTRFKPRVVGVTPEPVDNTIAGRDAAADPTGGALGDRSAARPGVRIAAPLVVVGVLALVLAAGVYRSRDKSADDASTPTRAAVPQDVTAAAFVAPVEASVARLSPTEVRFTWRPAEPEPGDFYLVTRTDSGPGPRVENARLDQTSFDLRTAAGVRPCVEIRVVRTSGQPSEPTGICAVA